MKRNIIVVAAVLMLTILGFGLKWCLPRLKQSSLSIHISRPQWTRLIVQSSNFKGMKIFTPTDALIVSPITHGCYTVSIEYRTGDILWTNFLHVDAGIRRTIDLYFDGNFNTNLITIRQIANGRNVLFEGTAMPKETSSDRPFSLGGI